MPLAKVAAINKNAHWALWKIEESIEDLWRLLNPSPEAQIELQQIHHHQKKLEWLASRLVIRYLVKHMGASFHGIYKDAFGKPHLKQTPLHISIAHCFPLAVGAIHQDHAIGIDIERPREKLLRIRDRFLNETEAEQVGNDLEKLCKLWTGKEVLYKIYGRKKLIFKENIEVFQLAGNTGKLDGRINYQGYLASYVIQVERFDGHFVAFSE